MQNADRMITNDVAGPGDRKCCNGYAAGERLELHDAECVGETRKNEDVGAREMCGEYPVVELAEKLRGRKAALELGLLRAGANDYFCAGQIERDKGRQVLLDRHPAHRHENRPREVEIDGALRAEQIDVDATRPHSEIGKAATGQFAHQRWRRDHSYRGGGMKTPQRAI